MTSSDMRTRILDAAERRARSGGYNAFSFRDIAQDVSIKSASVHYYFPGKADLARELVERYATRIEAQLGDPVGLDPAEAIRRVTDVFRAALVKDDRMCLCGLFGAERDTLPPDVSAATAAFFRMIIAFLETSFGKDGSAELPSALLARLEGALILARSLNTPSLFDQICDPGGLPDRL